MLECASRKSTAQWRAYALACTLTDTGIRIEEALGLRSGDLDFDNLLLKVRGKGRKERLVPFSSELRRVLFRWQQRVERERWAGNWVFATAMGTRLNQRNALRAHYLLLARLDIPKSGLHRLRHTFATSYLQHGGGCRSSVAGAWALADHYDDALSPSGDRGPTEATPAALDPQPISLKRVGRCPLDAALCFAEKIRSECSVRIRSEASERQETVP